MINLSQLWQWRIYVTGMVCQYSVESSLEYRSLVWSVNTLETRIRTSPKQLFPQVTDKTRHLSQDM